MTADLVAFVTARLDERERLALAAGNDDLARQWTGSDNGYPDSGVVVDGHGDIVVYDEGSPDTAQAVHIGLHDPAWALRDIAAKRAIVDMYEAQSGYDLPEGVTDGRDPDERACDEAMKDALETVVCQFAAIDSGHPDYRQEWKP